MRDQITILKVLGTVKTRVIFIHKKLVFFKLSKTKKNHNFSQEIF
jgi:hypothetical protein